MIPLINQGMEFFMFKVLKYLFYFLMLLSLGVVYLFFTNSGNKTVYQFLSQEISQRIELQVEIQAIDFLEYPQVRIVAHIERKAKLIFEGYVDDSRMDMHYTLNSNCIAIEECKIDDTIDIKGHIRGTFSRLLLDGRGIALDGNISYEAVKYSDRVEDVVLEMHDINSSKLFKLLGQTALIKGKANTRIDFSVMSQWHKKGSILYEVKDNNFKGIPLSLHTKVEIEDNEHTFVMDILSPHFSLNMTNGHYNQEKKSAQAHYVLDIKDLSKLETLFGYKYEGSFYAIGEMSYDKYFKVTGLSKSFGGFSDFVFEKDGITIEVEDVFLHDIIQLFPVPSMLVGNATGTISYNLLEHTLVVNTKLTHAKFLHCKLVEVIYEKSGANMLHETFDNSTLNLTYHDSILLGDLKLANEKSHIYLTNATIKTDNQTIDAYFDFKMQKQEFSGKVYGKLESPKVNLNMQKLIRYQMDKQVDKLIGKNNRKIMESMPMGTVAKEMATDVGASFMKVFF